MNWSVLRNEWGAVTFVLTVIAGMIIVPLAFYFGNVSTGPVTTPSITTSSSARASGAVIPSPSHSPSPTVCPTVHVVVSPCP